MITSINERQIAERLEQRLDELIKEQGSCTANMFSYGLSKRISDLEWIRGRRYIKCLVCGTDLTLKTCEHHDHIHDGTLKDIDNEFEGYK